MSQEHWEKHWCYEPTSVQHQTANDKAIFYTFKRIIKKQIDYRTYYCKVGKGENAGYNDRRTKLMKHLAPTIGIFTVIPVQPGRDKQSKSEKICATNDFYAHLIKVIEDYSRQQQKQTACIVCIFSNVAFRSIPPVASNYDGYDKRKYTECPYGKKKSRKQSDRGISTNSTLITKEKNKNKDMHNSTG